MFSGQLLRHLPALAILMLPLGALAWFGSGELGRLRERAEAGLRGQADVLAREAARRIELTVAEWARGLDTPLETIHESLVAETAERRRRDPRFELLGVLDGDATSLFPRPAPAWPDALPFLEPADVGDVREAEILEALGDFDGARDLITGWLAAAVDGEPDRARALFVLGGLERRADRVDAACDAFAAAALEARLAGLPQAATIAVLCDAARAEIEAEDGDPESLLRLVEAIAHGGYDGAVDAVLAGLFERSMARLPDDVEAVARFTTARELDLCRREGRRFAATYSEFLSQTVRRRLRQAAGEPHLSVVDIAGTDSSLLLLRALHSDERNVLEPLAPGAAWLFARYDLDELLDEIARPSAPAAESFAITLRTATASWPREVPDEPAIASAPTRVGLLVEARATNAPRALAERRRSAWNRAALLLALSLSAVGGAVLLIRSVHRERELLSTRVALVSRVTHELKTPLALIRMYAETLGLGRTRNDAERRRFADVIVREADGLTRLVERFLDFSSQQAGRLRYAPQRIDAAARATSLIDAYRPHAAGRGVELLLTAPPRLDVEVDPDGLDNALVNLIENAIKYTPADAEDRRIELTLSVDGTEAVLAVADRGIGVLENERELVFRGFHRGSNAGEIRGAGLGLQLVRHFARAHGGDVSVQPRTGGGSIFELRLPAAPLPAVRGRDPSA